MRLFAALFFILTLGLPASADVGAAGTSAPSTALGACTSYAMCVAQTATGICDTNADGTGENISISVHRRVAVKLMTYQSTATTYACTLTEADAVDFDTAGANRGNYGTDVTDSSESLSLSDLFMTLAVECTTITGGVINATLLVCAEEK